jgi:uncharacterized protein GlcG (DUF336 family)
MREWHSVVTNLVAVDPAGWPLTSIHMDDAVYDCIEVARSKARTVSLYGAQPPDTLANTTRPGSSDHWVGGIDGSLMASHSTCIRGVNKLKSPWSNDVKLFPNGLLVIIVD